MKVFGTIIDETGSPIPGANIASATYPNIVEASDSNGKFELTSDKITDISPIKISYVGYKDKYPIAKNLQGAKISLVEDIIALNEVVIRPKPKTFLNQEAVESKTSISFSNKNIPYIVAFGLMTIIGMVIAFKTANKSA